MHDHKLQHAYSTFTAAVLLASGLLCAATSALAQNWPMRPVRMIVPFAVGGGTDIQARLFSLKLQPALGQQVIVDNRTGAGGNIGAELVAKAPPDGYTVLFQSASLAVNATLYAIVRYLARKHGLGTLCPSDPRAAADADRWMEWYSTTLWNHMRPIFWTLIRVAPEKRNMTEVEDNRVKLAGYLAMADTQLAKTAYLAGTQFTMGDIPLAVLCHRWFTLPIERPAMASLERWFKAIGERPDFKEHCAAPLT